METKCSPFYYTCNGKLVEQDHNCKFDSCSFKQHVRVCGGKGGFGSMLRALGARIEKTTNHEACRDLSGRRMRDVNNEKNIAEWLKKKESDDEERKEKQQKKLENILNPKHSYEDKDYTVSLLMNAEKVDDALKHALKQRSDKVAAAGNKRKTENETPSGDKRKKSMWLGLDEDLDSDESDDVHDADGDNDDDVETEKINNKDNNVEKTEITEDNTNQKDIEKTENKWDNTNQKEINEMKNNEKNDSESYPEDLNDMKDLKVVKDIKDEQNVKEIADNNENNVKEIADNDENNVSVTTIQVTNDNHKESKKEEHKCDDIDLTQYKTAEDLEEVGLERLKFALMHHGLKCGGTLQERAKRLFLLKDTPIEKIDRNLFSKNSKKKKK